MTIVPAAVFALLLLLCSYHDLKRRTIPNGFTASILALGLLNSVLDRSIPEAISGILLPALPLMLIRSRTRGIGAGDIKLIAAIGCWIGWLPNLYVFLIACTAALLFAVARKLWSGTRTHSLPFAPFLFLAVLSLYIIGFTLL
ncbi:A24 family peptidase [Paenibacillus sp. KQZ6P-2]|uniref:A24 family peptidase n=1 Tax=Paenibacillus mangrovi TaxID=2931978 RepID=A0A9X1WQI6_9BACL|nr:A24 family peptidase [Paenibacillus mangrovi]MCJ8011833.1 A24 family peptidase [Paenibacillus mangrovi]